MHPNLNFDTRLLWSIVQSWAGDLGGSQLRGLTSTPLPYTFLKEHCAPTALPSTAICTLSKTMLWQDSLPGLQTKHPPICPAATVAVMFLKVTLFTETLAPIPTCGTNSDRARI